LQHVIKTALLSVAVISKEYRLSSLTSMPILTVSMLLCCSTMQWNTWCCFKYYNQSCAVLYYYIILLYHIIL